MRKNRAGYLRCLSIAALGLLVWSAPWARSQSSLESEMDNARIIQMAQKGLGDDVIIARIKAGATKFALSDDDLAALKKQGVSDAVVAAMIQLNAADCR